jgi:hypothetical protein
MMAFNGVLQCVCENVTVCECSKRTAPEFVAQGRKERRTSVFVLLFGSEICPNADQLLNLWFMGVVASKTLSDRVHRRTWFRNCKAQCTRQNIPNFGHPSSETHSKAKPQQGKGLLAHASQNVQLQFFPIMNFRFLQFYAAEMQERE